MSPDALQAGLRTQVQICPHAHLPALGGAHELAWASLLDQVCARAVHAGVGELQLRLPQACLEAEVQLRANLTPAGGERRGLALLDFVAVDLAEVQSYDWVALLVGGRTAPRTLKPPSLQAVALSGFVLQERRHVLSWQVLAWGALIRAAYLVRRPDLADRATFGMRRAFVSSAAVPAYYELTLWSRE